MKDAKETLKNLQSKINEAKTQIAVLSSKKESLEEKKAELEERCRAEFKCEIADLPDEIKKRDKKIQTNIEKISKELENLE